VGYRTRLDTRVSAATVIEVVTEGILTRMIQADPALEDYAAVIFDEFHERSLQADLGLALVRESQQVLRDDLRLLVMSATLDTTPLAKLLQDAPVLTSKGRSFPVAVTYHPAGRNARFPDSIVAAIREALTEETGSLLVFLPGVGEIRRVAGLLASQVPDGTRITPLYGNLSGADQDRAIAPALPGERKIVLATAIAETSITIDGIRVVIDSGQQRRASFDANSGMTRLVTGRLSKAAAEQRKGRAGRTQPGVCYRLWSQADQFSLADYSAPEITTADLAPLVLELAQWGARDPNDLNWIDPPPAAHWQQAVSLLQWLDLLDHRGAITGHGAEARNLGCHPRLAHMVLLGRIMGWPVLAAELAALLEERDLLGRNAGSDMSLRVQLLRGEHRDGRVDAALLKRVQTSARRLLPDRARDVRPAFSAADLGRLLACAYPDRIAHKRPGQAPRYQLSNGRGASLRDHDPLAREEWLVAAELDGQAREAQMYLAAPLDPATLETDLAHHISTVNEAVWDNRKGTVVARSQQRLGKLVLKESLLPQPSPDQMQQGLVDAVRRRGLDSLPWTKTARQWCARVELLRHQDPDQWPEVHEQALMDRLHDWLMPFLAGLTTFTQIAQLNLLQILESQLDHDQKNRLAREAPASLTIPSGQSVMLDYTAESNPVVAAKLQAFFGWTDTPTIANGRLRLALHLLSPAGRPLAVTSDLASFWQQAYPAVRKEMRGRYPKHPWPEDPETARPSTATKKRQF
ncbi:MAG: ATP-dependent helicase HrpB, partial [Oleiphilaceae bacterium]|nr:ATP-dependent helicase HrpB [Oleiphilaceae bacterium]